MDITERISKLKNQTKTIDVFAYEGCFYLGSAETAILDFVKNEPYPADFHVWLQKK
jgi:hypothetical protein